MEPGRNLKGPRALLPAEVEMCQVLGITEAEYWAFVDAAFQKSGERKEGYELIPDVQNATVASIVIPLVIGLAFSAVAALLAPKPRTPQVQDRPDPINIKTADATGPRRFATQAGFNTVQTVASLGEIIPLVFCQLRNSRGGVRVSAKLLWSRMTSWTTTQQFEGIYLFSAADLYERPQFGSYAIGDTLLDTYPQDKFRLMFTSQGGRLSSTVQSNPQGNGQYPETSTTDTRIPGAPFQVYRAGNPFSTPDFCGTRTPSSQTQFGAYAPMPNGMAFQLPYELIVIGDDLPNEEKDRQENRQKKIDDRYPIGAAIIGINGDLNRKGTLVTYRLAPNLYTSDSKMVDDWGAEDIRSSQRARREEIDTTIGRGSQYLVGQAITVCSAINTEQPWAKNVQKDFTFKVVEDNTGSVVNIRGVDDEQQVYQEPTIMRCAIGTVSNSRSCDVTEIGIRSTVWKQMNFTNVNSVPKDKTIRDVEESNGSIQIGQISKYIKRYSFFGLQARKRGSSTWTSLTGTQNIFGVRGNTPQEQYNFISITHPFGQYEFRFVPIPGNNVWKFWVVENPGTNNIYLLRNGNTQGPLRTSIPGVAGNFEVYFQGDRLDPLDVPQFSNPEWIVGQNEDWSETLNAYDALADYLKYDSESSSHQSAPEHEIVYVNEVIYNSTTPQYDDMAIAGINLWSDKEWTSLSEFSAYLRYGVNVSLPGAGFGPTDLLPDIVFALLTDPRLGAGELIGIEQVDEASMFDAARFCEANGFTWNGVITNRLNLREWIFEQAAYCLLDFTIIGGKFSLKPMPERSGNVINRTKAPTISALFTDGVVRDLKVTFIEPDDRKPFKAVVLYREDEVNGFPETRSVTVSISGSPYPEEAGSRINDPEEQFDLTSFCTVSPGGKT